MVMSINWRRLRRLALRTILIGALAPVVLSLALNVVQPVTTTVMLRRAAQRLAQGKRPVYPRRDVLARDEISPFLRRAVLAAEDDRFYLHHGFDFAEISKAIEASRQGARLRGASTITQQVARNLFLWQGRSFVRKGLEAYLTIVLELCLPKDRILDLYLNLAEWGDGIFGAGAAARAWYHKPAARLTREEAARLAAILPAPLRWPPDGSVASRRVLVILDRMASPAPRAHPPPGKR